MARGVGNAGTLTLLIGAAALAWAVQDHLSTPFDSEFDAAGATHKIPPNLLRAIGRHESGFNVNARNPKGAGTYPNGSWDVGLMQINTRTGARFRFSPAQLLVPANSIDAAARVLAEDRVTLGAKFSPYTWTAAYNVGPGRTGLAVGQAYAAAVLYHWQLYDFGRMFA